jgi:porin
MKNLTKRFSLLIGLAGGVGAGNAGHAATAPDSGSSTNKAVPFASDSAQAGAAETSTNAPETSPQVKNPAHYRGMSSAESKELTQQPPALWMRDTFFDDYRGWRSGLERNGIVFLPVFVGEVMGNPSGGMKQGTVYDHSLNVPLTVHLDKLCNGWEGGTLYGNVLWIAGRSLSADDVGDISGVSNIAGKDTVRVQELWYEQEFWQSRATLRVGLLAADAEFFLSDTASLFVNGAFGAFTQVSVDLLNPPFYPMAAPAVRFFIEPVPQFYFQSGVFKGNSGSQEENRNGLNYHFNGDDGVLVFSEIGWRLNPLRKGDELAGVYKLGSLVATANFHNLNTGASEGPNYAIYAVADQDLYRQENRRISFFTRGGGAPAEINAIDWSLNAGFNFAGFSPGRPDDILGVAMTRSWFSSGYKGSSASGAKPPFSAETVIEATWTIRVLPWWTLQPDFQYIFNPGGGRHSPDATVIGLRTTVVF